MKSMSNYTICELEIELTTLCNASCPLCYRNYISFHKSPYNQHIVRPIEQIISQLNHYPFLNYVMLVGSMSEPTLYPNFIQLVKYLKQRNIKIEICTNGSTKDPQFWIELAQILDDNDEIYFTICGSTQEIHEKYRQGTSLKLILDNAKIVRQIRPIDYAQCIQFNYNFNDLNSTKFKTLVSQFSHVYMTETFYPKDLTIYQKKFDITKFMPRQDKLPLYNRIKKIAELKYSTQTKGHAECQSLEFNRQQLDVFGNVYPCYLFLEHMNSQIWDNDYKKITALNYPCCKFCESMTRRYLKNHNLEYII